MTTLVETALVVAVLIILPFILIALVISDAFDQAALRRRGLLGNQKVPHRLLRGRNAADSGLA